MTDVLGRSQVIPYLMLLSDQFDISILSFEKPERLKRHGDKVRQLLEECGISWRTELFSSGLPLIPKLLDRRKMLNASGELHKEKKFDLIHCRSYVAAEAGWRLKRETGIRFLFDMRGFWVDERVEGGLWDLRNPVYRLAFKRYKSLEQKMLQDADAVVCLTRPAFTALINWGCQKEKIRIIPCAADTTHFSRLSATQRNLKRESLDIAREEKVLVYSGSLGTWYMLREMLEFFSVLRKKSSWKFLFLTPDDPNLILREADLMGIPADSIIIRSADREEMPSLLSAADAGIFFIRPTFSKTASSPTKLGEMLAVGIPVIANKGIGDVDALLTVDFGVLLNDFSQAAFQGAADEISHRIYDPALIRRKALEDFSLIKGAEAYRDLYRNLL